MKLFRLLFKPGLVAPAMALMFATAVCVALVSTRCVLEGSTRYAFLAWNLFLAWLPLFFALLLCEQHVQGRQRRWRLAGWGVTWLLFFPNAPYICTDLTHLTSRYFPHYWTSLLVILSCALTGLMVGFVSLYIVQSVVTERYGKVKGWLFTIGVMGLSGVGVFIGRFLRYNSWDVVWRPVAMAHSAASWMTDPFGDARPYVFSLLFAVFLSIAYVMFYTFTKLPAFDRIAGTGEAV
ncbi:MAG TPA: DUF1361 domain-containing protein [Verrucomicrobiae bacterium]|nr:DUF1361 domain-containing protein [Verrucomicrobiae bacterium]